MIILEKRFVYADNAATTRVSKRALDAAMPYFTEEYGNASSIYSMGMNAAKAILRAREQTAKALGADTNEIYFTEAVPSRITGLSEDAPRRVRKRVKSIL